MRRLAAPCSRYWHTLVIAISFTASLAAAQLPAEHNDLQRRIVDGLVAGKNVQSEIDQLRQLSSVPSSARVAHSTEAADFARELSSVRATLRDIARHGLTVPRYEELRVRLDALNASHMLVLERFKNVQGQLDSARANTIYSDRRRSAQTAYEQGMAALNDINRLVTETAARDSASVVKDTGFRTRFAAASTKALSVLDKSPAAATPILRASLLPYRPAQLAARAPLLTPTIEPSYRLANDELAAPTMADLAATVDAPLAPEILQKAKALEYDYVRIYEFVRNEIKTEWYAGAMKGAVGTLRQGSGNDVDQANLLIALFRASGLASRYVHGVIELPVEDVAQSLGLTDPTKATFALTRAGVAFKPIVRGGRVAVVQVEHTWVSAHVPYTNYRGVVVDASGKTWLPLAPALKRMQWQAPSNILRTVPINVDGVIEDFLGAVQPLDLLGTLRKHVGDYLQGAQTYEQQLGSGAIVTENIGLIPNTLPVTVVAVTREAPALNDAARQRVRIVVRRGAGANDAVVLDYQAAVSEFASERVTLSYMPATVEDQTTVNLFGGLDYVPAYLIKLRPQLKINGRQKAVASDGIDVGVMHRMEIQLLGPTGSESVPSIVLAGGYHAIGIGAQQLARLVQEDDPADTEYQAAALLSRIAYDYIDSWDKSEAELAGLLNVAVIRPLPTIAIASNAHRVDTVLDRPHKLEWQGVTLDAALRIAEPIARTTDTAAAKDWMSLSALQGSALEHFVFERTFLVDSISADKGLALARASDVPVLSVTAANVATSLPTLSHPAAIEAEIENWARLGMRVEIPRDPITHNNWTGSVWRVVDPNTGAAGYFISGGLAGGATSQSPNSWLMTWLADALAAANSAEPNLDPLSVITITKLFNSDGQKGEAGDLLPSTLAVLVRDITGRPVQGVPVTFNVVGGDGKVDGAATATAISNNLGIAAVLHELGQRTDSYPIYVLRNPSDKHVTRAGLNLVDAAVITHSGIKVINEPFSALAYPRAPASLRRTTGGGEIGAPGLWGDTLSVMVEDEFGNPISNVDVSFAAGDMFVPCTDPASTNPAPPTVFDTSRLGDGCPAFPRTGECGGSQYRATSTVYGAAAGVIASIGFQRFTVTTSAAGLSPLTTEYWPFLACRLDDLATAQSSFLMDENGFNINASKIGTEYKRPVEVALWFGIPRNGLTRAGAEAPAFLVSNGGSASAVSESNGLYRTFVTAGVTPGANEVTFTAKNIAGKRNDDGSDRIFRTQLQHVYGLDPRITQIVTAGRDPGAIHITADGQTEAPSEVQYHTPPANYRSGSTDVDFFKGDAWAGTAIGTTRSGDGSARLPRGEVFDPEQEYHAQVVVNRGSDAEVKSEKTRIPIFQPIFKDYTRDAHISQDVDVLNERVCMQVKAFEFVLTQAATVTLVFTNTATNARTTIISARRYDQGAHSELIRPSDLAPGKYTFQLIGVGERDGQTETKTGSALSEYEMHHRLPVGHTIVKGVDLFDGALVVGTTDFSLPGRGPEIEFRRTYGSNGSAIPGRLGVGWSHSYESKIIITPCGETIVIGGEGGGMRFIDDGNNGLKPLKGYHGTLIPNHADRTFDFYSKDGTRYHYRNFGTRAEWNLEFIEDTNGNVTKLGYDPTRRDLAKLITVEDPAKRSLQFHYEDKQFVGFAGLTPVVTRIDGPDGMAVAYTYDERGNITRAARIEVSGNTTRELRAETYAYTADPILAQHKLTAYTNPNDATTTYTYNEQQWIVSPGVNQLVLPMTHVEQVKEPEGGITRFEYDRNNHMTKVWDARNFLTTYTMNAYGSPLTIQDPVGTTTMTWATNDIVMTSKTNARGVRTDYTHDANGNVLTELTDGKTLAYTYETFAGRPIKNRVKTKTDRNGRITTYRYDTRGNLVSEINPENGEVKHSYAANGDRTQTQDPNGNVTRFTYDIYGNLETTTNALGGVTRTEFNIRGLPTRVVDPLQRATHFTHDGLDRLLTKTDALGGVRRFTYDDVGNKLTETDEEGRVTTWTYDKENRVKTIKNGLEHTKRFEYDLVGNKTLETDWKNVATTFEYDAANRLTKRTEPLNRITSFTYDLVGNVLTETDALTRVTTYEYDAFNRPTKKIDALTGVTEYGYDGNGNLTSEKDPLSRTVSFAYDGNNRPTQKTEPLGRVTRFKHDPNGNRTEETDPNGNVRKTVYDALDRPIRRIDAEANSTTLEYDAAGNLTAEINARLFSTRHEYDALNRRTKTVEPENATTTFAYDKVGNLTLEVWKNGNRLVRTYDALNRLKTHTDDVGGVLAYDYDENGNRTREVDANANVTVKIYDALNRLTQAELPETRTLKYSYDLLGNKTSETDANDHTTRFAYDALNRLEKVTDPYDKSVEYTYDAVGNKKTEKDKRGFITRFDYDDLNRLVKVTDALTQIVEFGYDKNGNKTSETDKRGTKTEHTYDKENRLTKTAKAGITLMEAAYDEVGNKKFDVDANRNITAYIYDGRNQLVTESRPLAAITQYQYDAIGNRTKVDDPEHRITTFTYDLRRRLLTETNGENQTTTSTYDGNGNRLTLKKPKGNTWTSVYDGANRLRSITDPLPGKTEYTYDKNGNRLTQVDANTNTTRYEYDNLNRQTAMVYPGSARAEFRYDDNGNRVGLTDPNGHVLTYIYDALNRETEKQYVSATPTGEDIQSIVTVYDANGNPTRITETYTGVIGTRVTTKSYDAFDRLLETTDAFGKTLKYQYDANGNRTALTDPDNKVTRYAFDALNRVSSATNAGGVTTYEYDRSSLPTKTSYPNGTTAAQTYDRARRTLTISNKQGAAVVSSYQYTYDANGNRATQIEANGAAPETTTYQYDTNDRLAEVAYPTKTTTYTYDAAYNRKTEKTVVTAGNTIETDKTYTYNNRNQLTQIDDAVDSANDVTYGFDANGNQTTKTKNGVVTTFIYDCRDYLVGVKENATTLGLFRFDYQGMRVEKDMGGQIVRYTYDDKSVLLQSDNAGATIAKYDYGSDRLLSLNHTTEGRQFYLFDALGSVSNLTNPSGTIQARYQYDAFGNFRGQAGSSYNRFTFTGHEKDTETGLYYFKARFYDPDTGRFINQDPYLGETDTPPSLHRYLYAYANPTVYIDLEGYESEEARNARLAQEARVRARLEELYKRTGDERFNPNKQQKKDPFKASDEQLAEQQRKDAQKPTITEESDDGSVSQRSVDDEDHEALQRERTKAGRVAKKFADGSSKGADVVGTVVTPDATDVAAGIVAGPAGIIANKGRKLKKGAEAAEDAGAATINATKATAKGSKVDEVTITYKVRGDEAEFMRQLAGQEKGINNMTAGEIKARIEKFRTEGRPSEAAKAIRESRRKNPSAAEGKAGLHNPDCCIGGRPNEVNDFGGIPENSAIGAQNRSRAQQIYDAVKDLPENARVKFNFVVEGATK